MRTPLCNLATAAALVSLVVCVKTVEGMSLPRPSLGSDLSSASGTENGAGPLDVLDISAPDGSAKASFIRAGAHVTDLWVKDRTGKFIDVVLGYDDKSQFLSDPAHPYFGAIVGRYANRIKNSTFTLPNSDKSYMVGANDNDGLDTLHGGFLGWDLRIWSLVDQKANSLTFGLTDPAGTERFPAAAKATVTYTLENDSKWKISMQATADGVTPMMLSQHTYFNLEAYQYGATNENHVVQILADKYVATDGILIPTGEIPSVEGTTLDFRQPVQLGARINETTGKDICGTGCLGIDNCFLYETDTGTAPQMSVWSPKSGIRLDIRTNQKAAQLYTCNGVANVRKIPRKASQGGGQGKDAYYENHSCMVLEQQNLIDAINHLNDPEWAAAYADEFLKPGETYKWEAEYHFYTI